MYDLPTDLQNIIYTFDTNDVNKQLYNKVMNELLILSFLRRFLYFGCFFIIVFIFSWIN
jgi:hypothetical protein